MLLRCLCSLGTLVTTSNPSFLFGFSNRVHMYLLSILEYLIILRQSPQPQKMCSNHLPPLPHTHIYIRREDDSNFINFVYLTLWFYTFGKLYYNKTCWYRLTRGIRIQHLNKTPHAYSSLTCCKPCLWSNWRALINTLKPWLEEENLHTEHLFAFWETTRTSNTPSRLSLNRRLPLRTN